MNVLINTNILKFQCKFHSIGEEDLALYNMNGFRIETIYDYYIAMKCMFFVVKLSSHLFIGYASFTILLS